MQQTFDQLRGHIGIIVPFSKLIEEYYKIMMIYSKVKPSREDIMIGTVDMFRGVEKKIIIVSSLRNSQTEGLGLLGLNEYINLATTRASQLLFFVGGANTITHNSIWNSLVRYCKSLTNRYNQNYIRIEDYHDYRKGKLLDLLKRHCFRL